MKILLVLLAAAVAAAAAVQRAEVSVHDLTLRADRSGEAFNYRIALFRVSLSAPFVLERGSADATAMTPSDEADAFGATRLLCGKRLFDSHPPERVNGSVATGKLPSYLVPLRQADVHAVTALARLFFAPAQLSASEFGALLLLSAEEHGVVRRNLKEDELHSCQLRFLSEAEQNWAPTVRVVVGGASFRGNSSFARSAPACERPALVESDVAMRAEALAARYMADALHLAPARNRTEEQCVPLPGSVNELQLLQTEIPGLDSMLKPILEGVLEPVQDVVGGVVGDALGATLEQTLGQTTDAGLTNEITSMLTHDVTSALCKTLPGPLVETVSDTVTEALSGEMRDYLTESLTRSITPALTKALDESLAKTVPAVVNVEASKALTLGLTRNLAHILSRSLTHSIAPALIQTLTHSPLQDYYCYYCFNHKAYCDYCSYSPSQLYYAMYYAGFYSTYYSDYYTDLFTHQLSVETAVEEEEKEE